MFNIIAYVVNRNGKWYVLSHDKKKKLGGPFDSKEKAVARLRAIEFFKKRKASKDDPLYDLIVDVIKHDIFLETAARESATAEDIQEIVFRRLDKLFKNRLSNVTLTFDLQSVVADVMQAFYPQVLALLNEQYAIDYIKQAEKNLHQLLRTLYKMADQTPKEPVTKLPSTPDEFASLSKSEKSHLANQLMDMYQAKEISQEQYIEAMTLLFPNKTVQSFLSINPWVETVEPALPKENPQWLSGPELPARQDVDNPKLVLLRDTVLPTPQPTEGWGKETKNRERVMPMKNHEDFINNPQFESLPTLRAWVSKADQGNEQTNANDKEKNTELTSSDKPRDYWMEREKQDPGLRKMFEDLNIEQKKKEYSTMEDFSVAKVRQTWDTWMSILKSVVQPYATYKKIKHNEDWVRFKFGEQFKYDQPQKFKGEITQSFINGLIKLLDKENVSVQDVQNASQMTFPSISKDIVVLYSPEYNEIRTAVRDLIHAVPPLADVVPMTTEFSNIGMDRPVSTRYIETLPPVSTPEKSPMRVSKPKEEETVLKTFPQKLINFISSLKKIQNWNFLPETYKHFRDALGVEAKGEYAKYAFYSQSPSDPKEVAKSLFASVRYILSDLNACMYLTSPMGLPPELRNQFTPAVRKALLDKAQKVQGHLAMLNVILKPAFTGSGTTSSPLLIENLIDTFAEVQDAIYEAERHLSQMRELVMPGLKKRVKAPPESLYDIEQLTGEEATPRTMFPMDYPEYHTMRQLDITPEEYQNFEAFIALKPTIEPLLQAMTNVFTNYGNILRAALTIAEATAQLAKTDPNSDAFIRQLEVLCGHGSGIGKSLVGQTASTELNPITKKDKMTMYVEELKRQLNFIDLDKLKATFEKFIASSTDEFNMKSGTAKAELQPRIAAVTQSVANLYEQFLASSKEGDPSATGTEIKFSDVLNSIQTWDDAFYLMKNVSYYDDLYKDFLDYMKSPKAIAQLKFPTDYIIKGGQEAGLLAKLAKDAYNGDIKLAASYVGDLFAAGIPEGTREFRGDLHSAIAAFFHNYFKGEGVEEFGEIADPAMKAKKIRECNMEQIFPDLAECFAVNFSFAALPAIPEKEYYVPLLKYAIALFRDRAVQLKMPESQYQQIVKPYMELLEKLDPTQEIDPFADEDLKKKPSFVNSFSTLKVKNVEKFKDELQISMVREALLPLFIAEAQKTLTHCVSDNAALVKCLMGKMRQFIPYFLKTLKPHRTRLGGTYEKFIENVLRLVSTGTLKDFLENQLGRAVTLEELPDIDQQLKKQTGLLVDTFLSALFDNVDAIASAFEETLSAIAARHRKYQ